jgi:hypothetical protein
VLAPSKPDNGSVDSDVASVDSQRHAYLNDPSGHADNVNLGDG